MADSPMFLGGGADIEYMQPSSVRDALKAATSDDYPLTPEQRELDAKLAALGVTITNVSYPTCPTGPDQWIKTKSSWPKCEEKLGMRWRTPEGWCYPESMCAIDEADVETKKLSNFRKIELYQRLVNALNAVRQPKRDEWLQKRSLAYIKDKVKITLPTGENDTLTQEFNLKDGSRPMKSYVDMTDAQRKAFADSVQGEMPASVKDLPTAALMKTQHDQYEELKKMAKSKSTKEGKDAQVKKLKETMRAAGVVPPAGEDLDTYAARYYDEAVACADASIGKRYSDAKASCKTAVGYGEKNSDGEYINNASCAFMDYGDEEDALCMPDSLAARKDKWLKGEDDELAAWFGELFDTRSRTKAAEAAKVARALGTRARAW